VYHFDSDWKGTAIYGYCNGFYSCESPTSDIYYHHQPSGTSLKIASGWSHEQGTQMFCTVICNAAFVSPSPSLLLSWIRHRLCVTQAFMEPGAYDIETTVVANSNSQAPVAVKHEHASSHVLLASGVGLGLTRQRSRGWQSNVTTRRIIQSLQLTTSDRRADKRRSIVRSPAFVK